jgi:hypothetical protein
MNIAVSKAVRLRILVYIALASYDEFNKDSSARKDEDYR